MIPERYIIYDEITGEVVNVVTVEDDSHFPPRVHDVMTANRFLNIGDMVPNEYGQQRRVSLRGKRVRAHNESADSTDTH